MFIGRLVTEEIEFQYDGPENIDYEGDFEQVNEIGHSARFVENHDRAATLLENGKYQASENEGYAGHLELVNEVGHSACFDENHDRSTHLSKNGKYQAENTGYDRDFNVPKDLEAEAKFNLNAGNAAFNDPKPTIEVKEKLDGQDSSIEFSSNSVDLSSYAHTTEKDGSISSEPWQSSSSKVRTASQSRDTKSRMLSQVNVASVKGTISNQEYKDMPRKPNKRHNDITCFIQVSSGSKANVLSQHKSTEQQPIARNIFASRASCTEKASHRLHLSVNRDKESVNSCQPGVKQDGSSFRFKILYEARGESSCQRGRNASAPSKNPGKERSRDQIATEKSQFQSNSHACLLRKRKKQRSNSYGEISISKQLSCLPSTVNLTTAQKKPRYACYAAYFLRALCYFNLVGLGDKVYTDNRKRKKQRSNNYREISISKKLPCLPFTVNLAAAQKKTRMDRAGRRQEQELQSETDGGWTEKRNSRCSEAKTDLASKTKSQSRPSTAAGARATNATKNTVRCLRAEVYNRCSTNERLNLADSP
ncbi:hypothetical protein T459_13571 [Capsicum annuum]|uniref:Uncharacterized protein n=1 Tax=Capsicum annuum TaxID=4072 RepID=A0A2G2ZEY9_CAPAN|nr:hypothetical protein T459_13571 [Capsicum annuum]